MSDVNQNTELLQKVLMLLLLDQCDSKKTWKNGNLSLWVEVQVMQQHVCIKHFTSATGWPRWFSIRNKWLNRAFYTEQRNKMFINCTKQFLLGKLDRCDRCSCAWTAFSTSLRLGKGLNFARRRGWNALTTKPMCFWKFYFNTMIHHCLAEVRGQEITWVNRTGKVGCAEQKTFCLISLFYIVLKCLRLIKRKKSHSSALLCCVTFCLL